MSKRNALLEAIEGSAPPAVPTAPAKASEPKPARAPKTASRSGTKLIAGHFPKKTWAALRTIGVEEDKTLQAILEEAIDLYLVKKGRGGAFRE